MGIPCHQKAPYGVVQEKQATSLGVNFVEGKSEWGEEHLIGQ